MKTAYEKLAALNPFRYRGYVWDDETGLYYLRSRYYKPGWGRFINADVLITGNLYIYCRNSLVNMVDADGAHPNPTPSPYRSENWRWIEDYERNQRDIAVRESYRRRMMTAQIANTQKTVAESKGISVKGVSLGITPAYTEGEVIRNFTVSGSYIEMNIDIYNSENGAKYGRLSSVSWSVPDLDFVKIEFFCLSDAIKPNAQWTTKTFATNSGEWTNIGEEEGWEPIVYDISVIATGAHVHFGDGRVMEFSLGHDDVADLFGDMIGGR